MAVIPGRVVVGEDGTVTVTWPALGGADTGGPVDVARYPIKTIQAYGTFGGATVTVEGSNDPAAAQWFGLPEVAGGEAISSTSSGGFAVGLNTRYIRPVVAGGTGSALTFVLVGAQKG